MSFNRRFTLVVAVVGAVLVSSAALAAGGRVAGTYTTTINRPSELKGTWALALARRGAYTVRLNGRPVAHGKYTATATTITFLRETGSGCSGPGTYAWRKSGKTVSFIRKRESTSCQGRAAVLAHRFTQVH